MNEDQPPPPDESTAPEQPSSLPARLFNVFAAPGELFEEVRDSRPSHGNWMVPLFLSMAVGVLFSLVVFSQPDIVAGIAQQQEEALAAQVESGKITQEQADKALEGMRQFQSASLMKIFGAVGAVIASAFFLVVISLMVWMLISKILKGDITFLKSLELTGLTGMINVLGGLVTMLIVLLKGNISAGPNAALFLEKFDPSNNLHQILGAISAITIWYLIVLSIGASRLSRRPFGSAAVWVFGTWIVVRFGLALGSAWWTRFQAGLTG